MKNNYVHTNKQWVDFFYITYFVMTHFLLLTIHTKYFNNEPSKLIHSLHTRQKKTKKSQFTELNVHKTLIIIKS